MMVDRFISNAYEKVYRQDQFDRVREEAARLQSRPPNNARPQHNNPSPRQVFVVPPAGRPPC
jgi:hypothetical protein